MVKLSSDKIGFVTATLPVMVVDASVTTWLAGKFDTATVPVTATLPVIVVEARVTTWLAGKFDTATVPETTEDEGFTT